MKRRSICYLAGQLLPLHRVMKVTNDLFLVIDSSSSRHAKAAVPRTFRFLSYPYSNNSTSSTFTLMTYIAPHCSVLGDSPMASRNRYSSRLGRKPSEPRILDVFGCSFAGVFTMFDNSRGKYVGCKKFKGVTARVSTGLSTSRG